MSLRTIIGGLVGTALLVSVATDQYFDTGVTSYLNTPWSKTIERTVEDVAGESDISLRDINRLTNKMEKEGKSIIALSDKGTLKSIESVVDSSPPERMFRQTIIARSDSHFLEQFYQQVSTEKANLIRENTKYVVFSPDITQRLGLTSKDVGGLSIGNGTIFIDTRADDGGTKNPLTYISIMGHEAAHEIDKINKTKLFKERYAFKTQLDFLDEQIAKIRDSPILSGLRERTKAHIRTADFLSQFGNDFSSVYPYTHILASHLLEGKVTKNTLQKYASFSNISNLQQLQLKTSSNIASFVLSNDREKAVRILYKIVEDPKNAGSFLQVTAASALHYLAPNSMPLQSNAHEYKGSGLHLHFGKDRKYREVGQSSEGSSGYGISGIPPLNSILKDEYNTGISYRTVSRHIPDCADISRATNYRLAGVNKLTLRGETLLIPDTEGRPDSRFFTVGFQSRDKNGDGIPDELYVFHLTNCIDVTQGSNTLKLTKVDVYDPDGKFTRSFLTALSGKHKGIEVVINPVEYMGKYKSK